MTFGFPREMQTRQISLRNSKERIQDREEMNYHKYKRENIILGGGLLSMAFFSRICCLTVLVFYSKSHFDSGKKRRM